MNKTKLPKDSLIWTLHLNLDDSLLHQNNIDLKDIEIFFKKIQTDLINIYAKLKRYSEQGFDFKNLESDFKHYYQILFFSISTFSSKDSIMAPSLKKVFTRFNFIIENELIPSLNSTNDIKVYTKIFDSLYILLWGLLEIIRECDFIKLVEHNIKNKTFKIYWQGIFSESKNTEDGRGALKKHETELLTRMIDLEGNAINPVDFLDIVNEMTHYDPKLLRNFIRIEEFDEAVLYRTFEYISKLQNSESPDANLNFSININPLSLYHQEFVPLIVKLILKFNINPKKVIIEILEYSKIGDFGPVNSNLLKLKELGFKIAVDDFPEGYNTIKQLVNLSHFDIVKLDGLFVMNTFNSCFSCEEKQACLEELSSVIDFKTYCLKRLNESHDLETLLFSLRFIKTMYPDVIIFAERIENEDVLNFLRLTGLIDSYQGYAFEKPKLLNSNESLDKLTISELENLLLNIENLTPTLELNPYFDLKKLIESLNFEILLTNSNEDEKEKLKEILRIINIDTLRVYLKENNVIKILTINEKGEIKKAELDLNLYKNRVPKEFVNLFKLLINKEDKTINGFKLTEQWVSEEGDDICIQVKDNIFLSFDSSEESKNFFSDLQYFSFILLANQLQKSLNI